MSNDGGATSHDTVPYAVVPFLATCGEFGTANGLTALITCGSFATLPIAVFTAADCAATPPAGAWNTICPA